MLFLLRWEKMASLQVCFLFYKFFNSCSGELDCLVIEHHFFSGATVYNAYIDGLLKGRDTQKAVEIFERMKRDRCKPSTETYTMMINLYGKVHRRLALALHM